MSLLSSNFEQSKAKVFLWRRHLLTRIYWNVWQTHSISRTVFTVLPKQFSWCVYGLEFKVRRASSWDETSWCQPFKSWEVCFIDDEKIAFIDMETEINLLLSSEAPHTYFYRLSLLPGILWVF